MQTKTSMNQNYYYIEEMCQRKFSTRDSVQIVLIEFSKNSIFRAQKSLHEIKIGRKYFI